MPITVPQDREHRQTCLVIALGHSLSIESKKKKALVTQSRYGQPPASTCICLNILEIAVIRACNLVLAIRFL